MPNHFSLLRVMGTVISVCGALVLLGPGMESKLSSAPIWSMAGFALMVLGSLLHWAHFRCVQGTQRNREKSSIDASDKTKIEAPE